MMEHLKRPEYMCGHGVDHRYSRCCPCQEVSEEIQKVLKIGLGQRREKEKIFQDMQKLSHKAKKTTISGFIRDKNDDGV